MIDFKKMDDKDFIFINKALDSKSEKAFSDFLKNRKKKSLETKINKKRREVSAADRV